MTVDFFHKILEFLSWILLTIKWFIRNLKSGNSDSLACLVGKTAIVTGGNAGIGFATTLLLASRGCKVIIACRSDATEVRKQIIEKTGNPNIEIRKLDLSSLKSVREFAENIKKTHDKIDILINNAGVVISPQKVTKDGLTAVMQINYFGHFLLTHLLLEPLKASGKARVVFIGSIMALFQTFKLDTINKYPGENPKLLMDLYSNSKYCSIFAAQEFGKKLRKFNINVNAADTGIAKTNILEDLNRMGFHPITMVFYCASLIIARNPLNAAQTSFHLASSEKLNEETGQLYFRCERFQKTGKLHDQKFCDDVWSKSEEFVGLKPEEKIKE